VGALFGIDIGGTNVKAALVSEEGAVLAFSSESWSGGEPEESVETAALLTERVVAGAGRAPEACGCACAGLVDNSRGVVISSPNLPSWSNVSLADLLGRRLGLEVGLENDANAAAVAEFKVGAARGATNAVMLTLGTGVGGGVIIGGRLYRGSHGTAGEIGHTTVHLSGPPCICGSRGCLEGVANAEAVVAGARELIASGRESSLSGLAPDGAFTSSDVGLAAAEGDGVAAEALASVGRALGVGLANVSQFLDPDVIVIGGGVALAGEPLLGPARDELESRLSDCGFRCPRVVAAQLGETAGVVGAALLALEGRG